MLKSQAARFFNLPLFFFLSLKLNRPTKITIFYLIIFIVEHYVWHIYQFKRKQQSHRGIKQAKSSNTNVSWSNEVGVLFACVLRSQVNEGRWEILKQQVKPG